MAYKTSDANLFKDVKLKKLRFDRSVFEISGTVLCGLSETGRSIEFGKVRKLGG